MDFQNEYARLFSDMMNVKIENLKAKNTWAEEIQKNISLKKYLKKIK
jgi:hypothetical protein